VIVVEYVGVVVSCGLVGSVEERFKNLCAIQQTAEIRQAGIYYADACE